MTILLNSGWKIQLFQGECGTVIKEDTEPIILLRVGIVN